MAQISILWFQRPLVAHVIHVTQFIFQEAKLPSTLLTSHNPRRLQKH